MPKLAAHTALAEGAARPDPHDFKLSREDWESAVFINASHFVLSRRLGIGEYSRVEFATWPEVLAAMATAPQPERIFLYAVTEAGRSVNLNGPLYPEHWSALWAKWRA